MEFSLISIVGFCTVDADANSVISQRGVARRKCDQLEIFVLERLLYDSRLTQNVTYERAMSLWVVVVSERGSTFCLFAKTDQNSCHITLDAV